MRLDFIEAHFAYPAIFLSLKGTAFRPYQNDGL
jgi:hypothetical protein